LRADGAPPFGMGARMSIEPPSSTFVIKSTATRVVLRLYLLGPLVINVWAVRAYSMRTPLTAISNRRARKLGSFAKVWTPIVRDVDLSSLQFMRRNALR